MFKKKQWLDQEFANRWEASKDKYYRLAYCYVKNESDALEILAEATYRGYCCVEKLKEIEYFDTWMSRIIINEVCRFLKGKKRFVAYEDALINETSTKEETGTSYEAVENEIDSYQLLDTVSEEEKTLLILKYFEERSFKEIGEILNLPENTVKTKTYRLLERLRLQEKAKESGISNDRKRKI